MGAYTDSSGNGHGFLLSKGRITNIDIPGSLAGGTFPAGINPQGDIVGEYNDTNFNVHCFLLRNGTFITFDLAGSPFNVA